LRFLGSGSVNVPELIERPGKLLVARAAVSRELALMPLGLAVGFVVIDVDAASSDVRVIPLRHGRAFAAEVVEAIRENIGGAVGTRKCRDTIAGFGHVNLLSESVWVIE